MKRITAILLAFAIATTLAACGAKPIDKPYVEPIMEEIVEVKTEEPTTEEQTTEEPTAQELTTEATTDFVPKKWPPLSPVKSVSDFLPVKESDYAELEKLVALMWKFNVDVDNGFVFDSNKEDAVARALDLMHGQELCTLFFQGDMGEQEWYELLTTEGDYGLKRWDPESRYMEKHDAIPADRIDWILQHVFNVKPDHTIHTDHWVYLDNYYYTNIPLEGTMWDTDYRTTVKKINKDKTVDVSIAVWSFDDYGNVAWEMDENGMYPKEAYFEDEYHFNITAGIREIDGVRQWTILRFEEKDVPVQQ